jgi:hypothetical protein
LFDTNPLQNHPPLFTLHTHRVLSKAHPSQIAVLLNSSKVPISEHNTFAQSHSRKTSSANITVNLPVDFSRNFALLLAQDWNTFVVVVSVNGVAGPAPRAPWRSQGIEEAILGRWSEIVGALLR